MRTVMPVEFALRPRIRMREDSPRPKRSRVRLPRFALPVALYWAVAGGVTYAFVHQHDTLPPAASLPNDEGLASNELAPREARPWWRPVPEVSTTEPSAPGEAATAAPEPAPTASAAALDPAEEVPPTAAVEPTELSPRPRAAEPGVAKVEQGAFDPKSFAIAQAPAAVSAEQPVFHEAFKAQAAPEPQDEPAPTPARSASEARNNRLPSCEAAIELAHQDIDFSQGNGTADLPTSAIAAVLENGAWLSSCSVPASTSLDVCVAIRGGSVIGASVVSRPANAELTACVRRRASALQFPYSTHVDIARTRF